MSDGLVAVAICDLGAIVRGRSLPEDQLEEALAAGVGWVPANQALTPLGGLAEPNPFGSTGDLRLLPDAATRVRVDEEGDAPALELMLCDIVELDGKPWDCCPRTFLKNALDAVRKEIHAHVSVSFEHEFQLVRPDPAPLPFSLAAERAAEPLASELVRALDEAGLEPQRIFSEFAPHQLELPLAPAEGLTAADRAVVLREVVRDLARRRGEHATFVPLLDPLQAGNGVHIHLNLLDDGGFSMLYDPTRPGWLSELGGHFAAGVLGHARALSALTAPSPVSAARLQPHRWSAGAVCLAERNREALLRIPPVVTLGGGEAARQLRLEYRGADAAANPYLALGAILLAGLVGVRDSLPDPPLLGCDPGELDQHESERFGVGALPSSLGDALRALEQDAVARGWLPSLMYEAYVSVKRAELAAVAELELEDICRRYADAY
jgi:glutamine synthetase